MPDAEECLPHEGEADGRESDGGNISGKTAEHGCQSVDGVGCSYGVGYEQFGDGCLIDECECE